MCRERHTARNCTNPQAPLEERQKIIGAAQSRTGPRQPDTTTNPGPTTVAANQGGNVADADQDEGIRDE